MAVKKSAVKKSSSKGKKASPKAASKTAPKSSKKTSKKASKETSKKTTRKSKIAGLKNQSVKTWEKSQKMIDEMLVKISPALQGKIDHLVAVLENSREGKLGDLSFLAGKILLRAQDVSRGLKAMRKRKDEAK